MLVLIHQVYKLYHQSYKCMIIVFVLQISSDPVKTLESFFRYCFLPCYCSGSNVTTPGRHTHCQTAVFIFPVISCGQQHVFVSQATEKVALRPPACSASCQPYLNFYLNILFTYIQLYCYIVFITLLASWSCYIVTEIKLTDLGLYLSGRAPAYYVHSSQLALLPTAPTPAPSNYTTERRERKGEEEKGKGRRRGEGIETIYIS